MIQCILVAGHIFISTPHLSYNITDGIDMIKGIDDGIAVYASRSSYKDPGISITSEQLEKIGFIEVTSENFLRWCYSQVE